MITVYREWANRNLIYEPERPQVPSSPNPILVSYIAKGLLPYRGLGSGIKRVLEDWPETEFTDDRDGNLFIATVHRKELESSPKPEISSETIESSPKSSPKTEDQIVELIRRDATISTKQLGETLGISKRAVLKQIQKLKAQERLERIGSAKGGHWEVIA